MAEAKKTTKRNFKKVERTLAEFWRPKANGETLEGKYLGAKSVNGRDGAFLSHEVADDEGVVRACSGRGLDGLFSQVPVGSVVRVTHLGLRAMGNGRTVRDYSVEVAE